MYNEFLDTFLTVADCGSISKASDVLHLTPSAILKQLNKLESRYELTLFYRTNRGLVLTEAGKVLKQDVLFIRDYSESALRRARYADSSENHLIRVGISQMNPVTVIREEMGKKSPETGHFQFHVVPFNATRAEYGQVLANLGNNIDIVEGVTGFTSWTHGFHEILPLFEVPVYIAVSRHHRLADRDYIEPQELKDETLLIPQPGESPVIDRICADLRKDYPGIRVMEMNTYDISLFNYCAETENVIFTIPEWAELNPMLKVIDVGWDYTTPYGIVYSSDAPEGVKAFIKYVEKSYRNNKNH